MSNPETPEELKENQNNPETKKTSPTKKVSSGVSSTVSSVLGAMKKGFNFVFDPIDNLEEKGKNFYKGGKEVRAKTGITKRNFLKGGKYLDIFRNTTDKKLETLLRSKDNRDKAFLEYLLENKSFEDFKPAAKFIPQLYIINPKATHDLLSLHSRGKECYSMADYIEIFRKSNDFSEDLSSLRMFCIKLAINSSKDGKKAGYLEFLKIILSEVPITESGDRRKRIKPKDYSEIIIPEVTDKQWDEIIAQGLSEKQMNELFKLDFKKENKALLAIVESRNGILIKLFAKIIETANLDRDEIINLLRRARAPEVQEVVAIKLMSTFSPIPNKQVLKNELIDEIREKIKEELEFGLEDEKKKELKDELEEELKNESEKELERKVVSIISVAKNDYKDFLASIDRAYAIFGNRQEGLFKDLFGHLMGDLIDDAGYNIHKIYGLFNIAFKKSLSLRDQITKEKKYLKNSEAIIDPVAGIEMETQRIKIHDSHSYLRNGTSYWKNFIDELLKSRNGLQSRANRKAADKGRQIDAIYRVSKSIKKLKKKKQQATGTQKIPKPKSESKKKKKKKESK